MNDFYWFKHDANARHDPKIRKIRREKGAAAKAVYWDLIEMLRCAGGKMSVLEAIDEVVDENHLDDKSIVEYVIYDSGLFDREGDLFWSNRLMSEIEFANERASRNRENGAKGGRPKKPNENPNETQKKPTGLISLTQTKPKPNHNNINNNININNIDNLGSSLHSEPCPTDEQSDAKEETKIFPETQVPVEKKPETLSNRQCQQVVDFWNRKVTETGAQFPLVKSLSEDRKKKIRIRWEEFKAIGNPVDVCRTLFEKACASKFLQGDTPKGWSASFDWLFTNGKNWLKVYEGNYDNAPTSGGTGRTRIDALKNELDKIDEIFGGKENGQQEQSGSFGVDEQ